MTDTLLDCCGQPHAACSPFTPHLTPRKVLNCREGKMCARRNPTHSGFEPIRVWDPRGRLRLTPSIPSSERNRRSCRLYRPLRSILPAVSSSFPPCGGQKGVPGSGPWHSPLPLCASQRIRPASPLVQMPQHRSSPGGHGAHRQGYSCRPSHIA